MGAVKVMAVAAEAMEMEEGSVVAGEVEEASVVEVARSPRAVSVAGAVVAMAVAKAVEVGIVGAHQALGVMAVASTLQAVRVAAMEAVLWQPEQIPTSHRLRHRRWK